MSTAAIFPEHERLYSVGEVARFMRVSKAVVYRLIWSERLEAGKISGSWRIPERALRAPGGRHDGQCG